MSAQPCLLHNGIIVCGSLQFATHLLMQFGHQKQAGIIENITDDKIGEEGTSLNGRPKLLSHFKSVLSD